VGEGGVGTSEATDQPTDPRGREQRPQQLPFIKRWFFLLFYYYNSSSPFFKYFSDSENNFERISRSHSPPANISIEFHSFFAK